MAGPRDDPDALVPLARIEPDRLASCLIAFGRAGARAEPPMSARQRLWSLTHPMEADVTSGLEALLAPQLITTAQNNAIIHESARAAVLREFVGAYHGLHAARSVGGASLS